MTTSEACYEGRLYVITNGKATLATATTAPKLLATCSRSASTAVQKLPFIDLEEEPFDIPLSDAADDCFNVAATGGTTTTLVDSVNRGEADSYWIGGTLYVFDLDEERIVTASDQSDTNLTVSEPFSSAITAGMKYSLSLMAPGIATADIDATGRYVVNEDKTGGKLYIDKVDLKDIGNEYVTARSLSKS